MNIVLIDRGQDRHPMLNLDAAMAQPLNLKRIVGRELNGLKSKHPQDECGYPVISKVIVETEVLVRLNGIKTLVLSEARRRGSYCRDQCRGLPAADIPRVPTPDVRIASSQTQAVRDNRSDAKRRHHPSNTRSGDGPESLPRRSGSPRNIATVSLLSRFERKTKIMKSPNWVGSSARA